MKRRETKMSLRLSELELELLNRLAVKTRRNRSDVVRLLIRDEAEKQEITLQDEDDMLQ